MIIVFIVVVDIVIVTVDDFVIVVVDNTAVLTTETKLCFRPQLPQLERLPHKMTMPMDPCKINEIILYKLAHVNSI